MELKSNTSAACAAANFCKAFNPDAPDCGTDPEHLSPLPTAEQMCVRALTGAADTLAEDDNDQNYPHFRARRLAHSAWAYFEAGIAEKDIATASMHLDASRKRSSNVIDCGYAEFRDLYHATLLEVAKPLLLASQQRLPTIDDLKELREGLGIVSNAVLSAPLHPQSLTHITEAKAANVAHSPCFRVEGDRLGLLPKLAGMMISARQNIVIQPASVRERQACGLGAALSHDAYMLDDGEKVLIKFNSRKKSDLQSGGHRQLNFDESIIHINVNALISESLNYMDRYHRSAYNTLRKQYGGRAGLAEIVRLLAKETHAPLEHAEQILLDQISKRMEDTLFSDTDSAKFKATDRRVESMEQTADWEILPRRIIELHANPNAHIKPDKRRPAGHALEQYLRLGHSGVEQRQLLDLISHLREVPDPIIAACCVGAYIDLARNPQTNPADAVKLVTASETIARSLMAKGLHGREPTELHRIHKANLYVTYADKYKKVLLGQELTIDDELKQYAQLLELAQSTLATASYTTHTRGIQFEIGLHLLNARYNIRNERIMQTMWPSLPREDSSTRFNSTHCVAWDLTVNQGSFLDQNLDARRIKCQSVNRSVVYDPAITVITAADDFGLKTSADLIHFLLAEPKASVPAHAARVKARLNHFEQIFLQKVNLSQP